CVQGLDYPLTF
nr:immunoglobulin light chain junction region [Macaca mulatta]MOV34134.1 immunoglobulin light chain junction region [Macaca mulatta]